MKMTGVHVLLFGTVATVAVTLFSASIKPAQAAYIAQSRVQRACGQDCTPPGTVLPTGTTRYFCAPGLFCKGGTCINPSCGPINWCCQAPPPATPTTPPVTTITIPPFKLTPAETTTVVPPVTVAVSPPTDDRVLGDCSGTTPGVKDGMVNLLDVEYFRKELNKEVPTLSCDFNADKMVDVIDFANYLRVGYSSTPQPTPCCTNISPQPSMPPIATPVIVTPISQKTP